MQKVWHQKYLRGDTHPLVARRLIYTINVPSPSYGKKEKEALDTNGLCTQGLKREDGKYNSRHQRAVRQLIKERKSKLQIWKHWSTRFSPLPAGIFTYFRMHPMCTNSWIPCVGPIVLSIRWSPIQFSRNPLYHRIGVRSKQVLEFESYV